VWRLRAHGHRGAAEDRAEVEAHAESETRCEPDPDAVSPSDD
jgi:hypothetical protein